MLLRLCRKNCYNAETLKNWYILLFWRIFSSESNLNNISDNWKTITVSHILKSLNNKKLVKNLKLLVYYDKRQSHTGYTVTSYRVIIDFLGGTYEKNVLLYMFNAVRAGHTPIVYSPSLLHQQCKKYLFSTTGCILQIAVKDNTCPFREHEHTSPINKERNKKIMICIITIIFADLPFLLYYMS